jgi:GntR family transcriptional regulator/MocR family aminotransferase
MATAIIYLEPESELSLQAQIRQKLVDAILLGTFPEGQRLPSSRKLADPLSVARNTVVLAYQQLIDEGYLISRERSGLYINQKVRDDRVGLDVPRQSRPEMSPHWRQRFKGLLATEQEFVCSPNWRQYAYPFLEGHFDHSLYPVSRTLRSNVCSSPPLPLNGPVDAFRTAPLERQITPSRRHIGNPSPALCALC